MSSKRVTIIGGGYAGLTTAASMAKLGHEVCVVDIDERRIMALRDNKMPFEEPGLAAALGYSRATTGSPTYWHVSDSRDLWASAEVGIICVPTPSQEDGSADLTAVHSAALTLSSVQVLVVKSTVPPGTCRALSLKLHRPVVACPEFLQEGRALQDAVRPSRIIIGSGDDYANRVVAGLWETMRDVPVIITDSTSAELIKYASNAYLATRIAFIDEIAQIAHRLGANLTDVLEGVGTDPRIGSHYLSPGLGYGGSCLPKDLSALIHVAQSGVPLLRGVRWSNLQHREWIANALDNLLPDDGLSGKTVALLGVTFKVGTGDMRESPAIALSKYLIDAGARVTVHDPTLVNSAPPGACAETPTLAITGADAIVLGCPWAEYKTLDWSVVKDRAVVIDPFRLWSRDAVPARLQYWGL